jgi:hypothetical protein
MNEQWRNRMKLDDARFAGDEVSDFGAPVGELTAARDGTVVVPLLHLGAIRVSGQDAGDFLHNLTTNDVHKLRQGTAQYNGFCTAKGRMLASFLVWREEADYLLYVSRDLHAGILKKLGLYILRSKVRIADASDELVLVGLSGKDAAAALSAAGAGAPEADFAVARFSGGTVIRFAAQRFCLVLKPDVAAEVWQGLTTWARRAGTGVWRWIETAAGVPLITAATQDEFVPQMTNFELIGGLSLTKGCYPGQEVVARSQYLGKIKRRMYLAHAQGEVTPAAGTQLYSPDLPDQSCGMVVNAAAAPGGGHDLLAVLVTASAEGNDVRLGTPAGPRIELRALPYGVG